MGRSTVKKQAEQKYAAGRRMFSSAGFFVKPGIFLAWKPGMFYTLLQKKFNKNIPEENRYEFIENTSHRDHRIGL